MPDLRFANSANPEFVGLPELLYEKCSALQFQGRPPLEQSSLQP
jgi:hypothetical protein